MFRQGTFPKPIAWDSEPFNSEYHPFHRIIKLIKFTKKVIPMIMIMMLMITMTMVKIMIIMKMKAHTRTLLLNVPISPWLIFDHGKIANI